MKESLSLLVYFVRHQYLNVVCRFSLAVDCVCFILFLPYHEWVSLTCPIAENFFCAAFNLDAGEIKQSVFPIVVVYARHEVDALTLFTGEGEGLVILVDPRTATARQR